MEECNEQTVQPEKKRLKCKTEDCEKCPICQEAPRGEVLMGCGAMHGYCFECVLEMIKANADVKCPECRKHCRHIIIPETKEKTELMEDFLWAITVIPDPRKHGENCTCFDGEFKNTSIYPVWLLENYLLNWGQLRVYQDLIKKCEYPKKRAQKFIDWQYA